MHKLEEYLDKEIILLQVKGCASLLCFRKYLPASLHFIETNDDDLVTQLTTQITQKIQKQSQKKIDSYFLNHFTKDEALLQSSPTLLNLISLPYILA